MVITHSIWPEEASIWPGRDTVRQCRDSIWPGRHAVYLAK